MTKEQQDISWACLPKEARDMMTEYYRVLISQKKEYICLNLNNACAKVQERMVVLEHFFGHHNLTLDTEPEEMLMVKRNELVDYYSTIKSKVEKQSDTEDYGAGHFDGQLAALDYFFSNKCLPDKEPSVQVEPKFKVGDKVRIIIEGWQRDPISEVIYYDEGDNTYKLDALDCEEGGLWVKEWQLEPYTEPETKENMEEKELNLVELLKGCEREELYSPSYGKCVLREIYKDNNNGSQPLINVTLEDGTNRNFSVNGKICWAVDKFAPISLFPSRALYEKYPLDPYSAWMAWKEARKPKRWHPKNGEGFWCISPILKPHYDAESDPEFDWESDLNHFETEEMCKQATEAVRECLEKFHKAHTKQ